MTAIVFVGPTICAGGARQELDAIYLPPVAQGDVYRAAQRRPSMIGIVDGYFEREPAVWHKEILWAMSQGIHVFGSASMGALRAAELAAFGMEGVGEIFEAYRDGTLEDDDEVAVAHGPAELDFRGQSEAMVNIRYTLARAAAEGVICPETRTALEGIAKGLFYPERSYPLLLQLAARQGIEDQELRALRDWLPHGQVNQKRDDAIAMLRLMRRRLADGLEPKRVRFSFEHTVYWEHARIAAGDVQPDGRPDEDTVGLGRLLDELRLAGVYPHVRQSAMGRSLGIEEARRQNMRVSREMLQETADAFRRDYALLAAADAERWMAENHLDGDQVERFVEEEALLRWTQSRTVYATTAYLLDHLRSTGDYSRFHTRALEKQRALESQGLENPGLEDAGLTEQELFQWYFERRLGRPAETDLANFARRAGFADQQAFKRAVLREYLYSEREAPAPHQGGRKQP